MNVLDIHRRIAGQPLTAAAAFEQRSPAIIGGAADAARCRTICQAA